VLDQSVFGTYDVFRIGLISMSLLRLNKKCDRDRETKLGLTRVSCEYRLIAPSYIRHAGSVAS
jgi:hypothetical protein